MLVVAFGDLQTPTWGVSWIPQGSASARLALRAGATTAVLEGSLEPAPQDEPTQADEAPWRFTGERLSLVFTPAGPPIDSRDPEGRLELRDQPCEVSGQVRVEGADVEVSCPGWRSSASGEAEVGRLDSWRYLAGWFDPPAGFSLLALRPHKARGHEADVVAAALIDDPPPPPIADPRLSTTYTEQGVPARAGLELWLKEESPEAEDSLPQYPRRAAGHAAGGGLEWSFGDFELRASLLRWHSHGQEGAGVYVLGRQR